MAFARTATNSTDSHVRLTVTVEYRMTLDDLADALASSTRETGTRFPTTLGLQAVIEDELADRGDDAIHYWYERVGPDEDSDAREKWALDEVTRHFGGRFPPKAEEATG